jgi:hypothetical protein
MRHIADRVPRGACNNRGQRGSGVGYGRRTGRRDVEKS